MQTAVRKRRLILIFGAIPPPRNFAKIHTRGGRGLQPVQPKDSIPPWGHAGTRRARRGGCAGVKRAAAHWRRCASAGVVSPGRRGQGTVPGGKAGASGRGEPEPSFWAAGGGHGGKAGAAPRCRGAAGGGAGKTAAPSAARVGFQATSAIEAAGGRKSTFLPYKEALFPGARLLSNQSCFAPESLSLRSGCFFGGAE